MSPLIRDGFKAGIPSAAYLQGSKRLKDSAKFRLSEEKANVFALLSVRNLSK